MIRLPRTAWVYLYAIWSVAVVLLGVTLASSSVQFTATPLYALWLVLFVLADYFEVEFEAGDGNLAIMTVTDAVTVFLVAVGGGSAVLIVLLGTLIVDVLHRHAWFRNLFNCASRVITFVFMWWAYRFFQPANALPFTQLRGLLTFSMVASINFLGGVIFVGTIIALVQRQSPLQVYRESIRQTTWVYLVTLPIGALLAVMWRIDITLALIGIIPLVMARRSYQALAAWQRENRRNQVLAQESRQLADKLERLQGTATAMLASREPLDMLETVSTHLAGLMQASASWVILLDTTPARVVSARGVPTECRLDIAHCVAELQGQSVQVFAPPQIVPMVASCAPGWQALVLIPLLINQQRLGGIFLASDMPIDLAGDDRRVLLAFAGQAALAMEHARLFAELRDKQEEFVRSSKLAALGTFSAGIAHEFNNLLAGILGHAELGLMSDSIDEKDASLQVAVRTSLRGKSITRGLLTFARRSDPQRDLYQLRDIVEDTVALVGRELAKLNIQVECKLEAVPLTVCDQGQIAQVVLNLITNARDALTNLPGGIITIGLTQVGQYIELTVSDTGCGIAPEMLAQVFQPFVTTKGALGGSTTPGTGLGLAISYGIVESHKGTIGVQSILGQGTTMTVRLPILGVSSTQTEVSIGQHGLPKLRILVVDDESVVANVLVRILAEHGHSAVMAYDGARAIELYRQKCFDLVISDLIMPGMNGLSLFERLQEIDPDVRLLVMTGQAGAEHVDLMLRAGACGVIHKPFMLDELLAAIEHSVHANMVMA